MTLKTVHKLLTFIIAAVWFVNGLICKILNYVPRHEEIVASILGGNSFLFTILIGSAEVLMAVWILSGIKSRINAILQILIIMSMNVLEFTLAPDLLLWGRFNILFAIAFSILIYFNQFILKKKITTNGN